MTAKTFATLNPNALGSGLALDLGNLVVTTNADSLDGSRAVFGTIPKAVGHGFFAGYFYSTSRGDLSGLASIGLCRTTAGLDKYVGQDSLGWGLRPFDGGIWHNGASVVSGNPMDERLCISVYCNFNAPTGPYLAWFVDGSFYASVILPTDSHGGFFWVPAVSIGGDVAGDLSCFVNFGQRPFDSQPMPVNS